MTYADIIDELIKNGKEIDAIYFASEAGLTERFPPLNLLKSYHRNYKKNVSTTMKKGNNNHATMVGVTTFLIQFHFLLNACHYAICWTVLNLCQSFFRMIQSLLS